MKRTESILDFSFTSYGNRMLNFVYPKVTSDAGTVIAESPPLSKAPTKIEKWIDF